LPKIFDLGGEMKKVAPGYQFENLSSSPVGLTQKNKQSLAIEPNQVRILKSFPFVNVECDILE